MIVVKENILFVIIYFHSLYISLFFHYVYYCLIIIMTIVIEMGSNMIFFIVYAVRQRQAIIHLLTNNST
jgi:hypothetical protein